MSFHTTKAELVLTTFLSEKWERWQSLRLVKFLQHEDVKGNGGKLLVLRFGPVADQENTPYSLDKSIVK
jgi:hypothetical protein